MTERTYVPRIVILVGLTIDVTASYLLPRVGYDGTLDLTLLSLVGTGTLLAGIALLFYYE
ncbi:hypothetical protein [Halorussus pelagicus]|uniref:hypothetical protein n=1 Tax=Halorussus pelagicus TaxID=2505977 RepID=UPI000FFBC9EC|nr:hypothetical protein [Halorussus pelagicus]